MWRVGQLAAVEVDNAVRPFLPIVAGPTQVGGWVFPEPADHTGVFMKTHVSDPAARRQPCYVVVPRDAVSVTR